MIYCECGHTFTERDICIGNDGPEDRAIFECPDCHCITEFLPNEVSLKVEG